MFKVAGKLGVVLLGAVALSSCGNGGPKQGTGSVQFSLDIPGGQKVDTLKLHLVCPSSGVDLTHTLDVKNGEVTAVFGGLQPETCTVEIQTQTQSGVDCVGARTFTVVAKQTITVEVPLICQGINDGPVGIVKITPKFEGRDCSKDRIKIVYAIPANVLVGESTVVQVETYSDAVVGTPKITWAVRNDAFDTGQGTLSPAPTECKPGSAACNRFTCTGLGANPTTDPQTQRSIGGAFVSVTLEDDHCFDTEEVWVYCRQASQCGDGTMAGAEECDDSNTANNDGCSSACRREVCGDGIVQTGEECDGSASAPQGQACSAACKVVAAACGDGVKNQASEACDGADGLLANQQCGANCQIVPVCGNGVVEGTEMCDSITDPLCVGCMMMGQPGPRCGDGIVNQTSEKCDGTAGLMTGQECGANCQIVPKCGNNIVEGTEACDSATDATCVNCMRQGQTNACDACISTIPEVGDYRNTVCKNDPLCNDALKCILANPGCWTHPVPLSCFCGNTQAQLDACEMPTFTPAGPCAALLKAGAGAGASNADVTSRYFDLAFPSGAATLIVDTAFLECNTQCF